MWNKIKEDMNSKKGTEAQIKYAELLLEALYGDINQPIYTMPKSELSKLIDDTKELLDKFKIDYHHPDKNKNHRMRR